MIHIYKNIYKNINASVAKKSLYALISVKRPINKQHSLEFSIDDGYTTPNVANAYLYDPEIQKEMDVIIAVLNRIFDEDNKEYYIGNKDRLVSIHSRTNNVLENINKRTAFVSRKK